MRTETYLITANPNYFFGLFLLMVFAKNAGILLLSWGWIWALPWLLFFATLALSAVYQGVRYVLTNR